MRRPENRDNRRRVALPVEVLEVQSIVPDLVNVVSRERFGANLEFDHEENRSENQYRVDPAPDTRDDELEKDGSFDIEIRVRHKTAENCRCGRRRKLRNVCYVVGAWGLRHRFSEVTTGSSRQYHQV